MQKIISLFKRDYEGNRLVYDEVVEGAEWVQAGEGVATRKYDGTACLVDNECFFKRYDRKKHKKTGEYKDAPRGWMPAQDPDEKTGHWPGWVPIGDEPESKWHREAWEEWIVAGGHALVDGTYEACGPKLQGNPEGLKEHRLIPHGAKKFPDAPRTFNELYEWFKGKDIEGLVWHHPDGRMVKIKKRDFGLARKD